MMSMSTIVRGLSSVYASRFLVLKSVKSGYSTFPLHSVQYIQFTRVFIMVCIIASWKVVRIKFEIFMKRFINTLGEE